MKCACVVNVNTTRSPGLVKELLFGWLFLDSLWRTIFALKPPKVDFLSARRCRPLPWVKLHSELHTSLNRSYLFACARLTISVDWLEQYRVAQSKPLFLFPVYKARAVRKHQLFFFNTQRTDSYWTGNKESWIRIICELHRLRSKKLPDL